jgi:hypothetical protein
MVRFAARFRRADTVGNGTAGETIGHRIYGALQVKLAASLVLPVPLYVATCG